MKVHLSLRPVATQATVLSLILMTIFAQTVHAAGIPARYYEPVPYRITLQGDRGQFASVENDGKIHVNRTGAFRNEMLTMIDLDGGVLESGQEVALKSWQGWHVSARYNMGSYVMAGQQWGLGTWEKFRVYLVVPGSYTTIVGSVIFSDKLIVLRSSSGRWLSARYDRPNTPLSCDQSHTWAWETFRSMTRSYSRGAAANYALKFALDYNSQFRTEANDCTNFASQSIYAGGIPKTPTWSPGTVTWIRADAFYRYLLDQQNNLGYAVSGQSSLYPGDIIAVDWTINIPGGSLPGRDGVIDHIMVVTERIADGRVRVSYHSSNRRNELFDDIRNLFGYTKNGDYRYIRMRD